MLVKPITSVRTLSVCLAVIVASALAAPAGAAPDRPGSGTLAPSASGETQQSHRVTLVTGDTVQLDELADGRERASLVAGKGDSAGYHAFNRDGDAYLVPSSAQRLIARDRLDLELFNISALVDEGDADGDSPTLPLIVTYRQSGRGGPGPSMRAVTPPPGSTRAHVLESIDGIAVTASKAVAARFWDGITSDSTDDGPNQVRLVGGIDKIWLDARVEGTLDQSAAEIGAPVAWKRGWTGKGVTIATLDSGVDASHPDFQGRIIDTADFTGGDSVEDRFGHGTHVLSIAGGSGAAADEKYRGIAPDASLMAGKVLDDDGLGNTSDAIDGMEWASANGADVVNMSLGGPVTRGDDPMSQAVNRLTAEDDVLFVVAAGNYSPWNPGMEFVTSPAAADSALAVGALRQADSLWTGSRRGRMDGDAIKPEIVAPGFNITAAGSSAAGLPPYVSKTGTSMAAPHVSGAAALLKQQHPTWGAEELRDALTSTAQSINDNSGTYEQGAGRVDLDRATAQDVFVDSGVLHMGNLTRPFGEGELNVSKQLTYRNASPSAVTLDLGSSLRAEHHGDLPGDALTVEPSRVTLTPGEKRDVTVKLDARSLPSDTYSGAVTAVTGATRLTTTVGFSKQDDTVDLTLRAVDRNGDPGTATVRITPYKERDPRYYPDYIYLTPQQPEYTLRVPEGAYNLWSLVTTFDKSGRYAEQKSIVGDPKLEVGAPNFGITLDARDAVPVSLDTPRPSQPRSMTMSWWRGEPGTTLYDEDTWSWSFNDGEPEKVSVTPTERVHDSPFGVVTSFDAGVPPLVARAGGRRLDAVQVAGQQIDGRRHLPVTDAGTATPDELADVDLEGRAALVQESALRTPSEQVKAAAEAGAGVAVLYSAHPGVFWPSRVAGPIPVLTLPKSQGQTVRARLQKGDMLLHLTGRPRTPYAYDVSFAENGAVPHTLRYRVKPSDLAQVKTTIFTTGAHEHGWRLHQSSFADCDCGSPAVDDFVPSTGYTRTEYVTARPDVNSISAWQFLFGYPADVLYSRDGQTYRPGEQVTEEWLKAPLSPGVPQSHIRAGGRSPVSVRNGDYLYYSLAALTDAAGHWMPTFSQSTSSSRLYRDGEQIYGNGFGVSGSASLPSEPATYRLEADVDHDGTGVGLSTRTRTAWTFRSAGNGSEQVLPLIDVDYVDVASAHSRRSALDSTNTARPGARVALELKAAHQDGSTAPPVDDMSVQVSYDDGATWRPTHVTSHGESFSAIYRHPLVGEHDGYVSLRVDARDGAGGKLQQTLIRAYRLGDR